METLEVIAEFKADSSINIIKILWKDKVFDMSYNIFHQWRKGNWMHFISVCENKKLIMELKFDTFFFWEVLSCERLN